jgi:hypothetical protein
LIASTEIKTAKEESFWSSFSRKACGEHERQSLSVKAQRRRGKPKCNSRLSTNQNGAAIIKRIERGQTNVHALSIRVKLLPRPPSNSVAPLTARPEGRGATLLDRKQILHPPTNIETTDDTATVIRFLARGTRDLLVLWLRRRNRIRFELT